METCRNGPGREPGSAGVRAPGTTQSSAVPWYGFSMVFRRVLACLAGAVLAAGVVMGQGGVGPTLQRAAELARSHRYAEVIKFLEPLEAVAELDTPEQFELDAELGRALFHMGRYPEAYRHLAAALAIQPRRMEIGVYLEAAAWATGRRNEALKIFDGILASGARDLYLPVTLPGERSFLADPRVWQILDRHRQSLALDLATGSLGPATLGDSRSRVVAAFHLPPNLASKPVITARAGPAVLWILRFDERQRLDDILIDVQHVARYSPYRLEGPSGLGARWTPAQAMVRLGSPTSSESGPDGTIILRWRSDTAVAVLEFGTPPAPPSPGISPGAASLLMVRLRRPQAGAAQPGSQ